MVKSVGLNTEAIAMGVAMLLNGLLKKTLLGVALTGLAMSLMAATDPYDNDNKTNPDFPKDLNSTYANNIVSLSSDAHYAVTSNMHNQIVLWDLQKHTYKIISNHANSYSAYFIKNSPYFMWQSLPKQQPQMATSAGKPPLDKLKLVGQNKLALISEENKKFYIYYYGNPKATTSLGHVVKVPYPQSINAQYLLHGDLRHYGDNFDFSPYEPHYNHVSELVSQMRFIQVLISVGYHSGNIVHVQDPAGHEVLHFDNFPVYGQVMRANLKDYFASSFNWNVFMGYGAKQKLIMIDDGGFYSGKLLNLSLSDAKPFLLTTGEVDEDTPAPLITGKNAILGNFRYMMGLSRIRGITLWDTNTGQPLHKFVGTAFKTYGTLSPNGDYVVAGDENSNNFVWSTNNYKKIFRLWNIYYGQTIGWKKNGDAILNNQGLIKPPKAFNSDHNGTYRDGYSFKFITSNDYLKFPHNIAYAILYHITDPKPIKYFNLGKTSPAIFDFSQDEALDSSPSKHILVMAMSGRRGGILEYQYDSKLMTLKRIWIGHFAIPASS